MNETECIADLFCYETERVEYLKAQKGSLKGFDPKHGALLAATLESDTSLKAHLVVPRYLEEAILNSENRQLLTRALAMPGPESVPVTHDHVAAARGFVTSLLGVSIEDVSVITAPEQIMNTVSVGVTYACGTSAHVVVVPESVADPIGTLIYQFAIAAHYSAMRAQGTIASMTSDMLTQAMIGRFAVTRWARESEPDLVAWQLREIAQWEFAIGLGKTPTYPMGFLVSDLGVALLKDYGDDFFKKVMNNLYDSMTDGMAMWWGTNNFYGTILALGYLEDLAGMRKFISQDAGNKTLDGKLKLAMAGDAATATATANKILSELLALGLPPLPEEEKEVAI